MGQKVRPTGFRTGIMVDWLSRWYANKQDFAELLVEDVKIRRYVKKRYGHAGISRIKIERTREKVVIYVYAARVGIIIGKKGQEVDKLTRELETLAHRHIEVKTAQGHIGIKVWINNGDYLDPEEATDAAHAQASKVPKKPTRQGKR